VTTKPGAQSFATELPTANWSDIWIALLGLGVLTALTGFITSFYSGAAFGPNSPFLNGLPADQRQALERIASSAASGASNLGAIIWVPIGFFILVGILFVSARIFGGSGSFLNQSYAFMLYYVPINGLAALLGLVPFLGGLVGFALWIYSIVLAIFAMMASQRLTGGRATAAVLVPFVLGILLLCSLFFILIAAIVAAVNGTR
jgi:hypothetical protein